MRILKICRSAVPLCVALLACADDEVIAPRELATPPVPPVVSPRPASLTIVPETTRREESVLP
jgi:hypothetical protein